MDRRYQFLLSFLLIILPFSPPLSAQTEAGNPQTEAGSDPMMFVPGSPLQAAKENARARFEYFYNRVSWPTGSVPVGARARAWQQAKHLPHYSPGSDVSKTGGGSSLAATLEWRNVGPFNIGGRIFALALNPQNPSTIFVGAANGGIWRSYDNGLHWKSVSDDFPTLSMGSIVINPLDTTIVYAGTGDASFGGRSFDGRGMFKSTDAGDSWFRVGEGTLPDYSRISDMAINPVNPDVLYAAVPDGVSDDSDMGIWRSIDAGDSWALVLTGRMTDIVINPLDPDMLYTVSSKIFGSLTAERYGLWKTIDGGDNWFQVDIGVTDSDIGRTAIGICAGQPDVLYLGVSEVTGTGRTPLLGVFKTIDAGATWEKLEVPFDYMISQGWFDNIIGVHPSDPDIVYAGGVKMIRSSDGGRNWDRVADQLAGGILHVDQHEIEFNPSDPDRVFVGNDGGLFLLTGEGRTLEKRDVGLSVTQFIGGDMYPGSDAFLFGGTQDNGTLRSSTAPDFELVLYGDGGNGKINPLSPNIMYTTQERLKLWRSEDFGRSWIAALGNLPNEGSLFYVEYDMDRRNPETLFLGTYRMYKTDNGGVEWQQLNTCPFTNGAGSCYYITSVQVAPYDGNVVLAAAPGQTGVSLDGGATWEITNGQLPLATVTSFRTYSPGVMYSTLSLYGVDKVWKSTDYGRTWNSINGNLPDVPANDIVELDGTLVLGTDLGVFASGDGGTTWERFGTGMPAISVQKFRYQEETGVLRAFTHGRGLYDLTWKQLAATAPVFMSHPDTTTLEMHQPFVYAPVLDAVPGPDFRLLEAPQGADIDPVLGVVTWTASDLQARFTIEAENSEGSTRQVFTMRTHDVISPEWEIVSPARLQSAVNHIFAAGDQSLWMIRDTALVSRSIDGGRNWEHFELPGLPASVIGIYAFDKDRVFVGTGGPQSLVNTGSGHIWKSIDGGESWTDVLYGIDSRFGNIHFFDGLRGIAISQGATDSADVFRTSDGGDIWSKLDARPYARIPLYNSLTFTDELHGWFASSNVYEQRDASILLTVDGGLTWQDKSAGGGFSSVSGIAFLDSRIGFCVDEIKGRVRRTLSGGDRWLSAFYPMNGERTITVECDAASGRVWIVSDQRAWVSGDAGKTWAPTQLVPVGAIKSAAFTDSIHGWAVTAMGIVQAQKSDPLTSISTPQSLPSDIALAAAYPNPIGAAAEGSMIPVVLNRRMNVSLKIYSSAGHELTTLLEQELPAGTHYTAWDASGLSNGVYFVVLRAGGKQVSRSIVVAR